jgi:methionyl-tRNA formyltransferase
MRLVFFGTPQIASRCLEKILTSRHRVEAVVTAPDKPKGRGMKLEAPDVKRIAQSRGLEILQPVDLTNSSFLARLAALDSELFCVVAFRILPEQVYAMPPHGCVNLHASLLPKYRGAAPINWAIINGETETGLTTFFIRRRVDTGDIILREPIAINPEETFGELHDRMADKGGDLLIRTIDMIESGGVQAMHQDGSQATRAPKISPEICEIDWNKPAIEIHNLIRGLSPKPGAYTFRQGKKIIILKAKPANESHDLARPGEVIKADPHQGMRVACGIGAVELLEMRPESGKTMSGAEYVRGRRLTEGEVLGRIIG